MSETSEPPNPSDADPLLVQAASPPTPDVLDKYIRTKEISLEDVAPVQGKLKEKQEETRAQLAIHLLWVLTGTISASFVLIFSLLIMSGLIKAEEKISSFENTGSLVKDLVTIILTAQTGLIGTALGFYFGSKGGGD